jgi:hypothetical protein
MSEETTVEKVDKRQIDFLKYLNSFLLSCILGFSVFIFTTVTKVKDYQSAQAQEIVRMQERLNTLALNDSRQDAKIANIEQNNIQTILEYMEKNFIKKPEKR